MKGRIVITWNPILRSVVSGYNVNAAIGPVDENRNRPTVWATKQGPERQFTKLFSRLVYLDVLLKGRERVKHHAAGLIESETPFRYEIAFQNRRMEWQLMECGDINTLFPERNAPDAQHQGNPYS